MYQGPEKDYFGNNLSDVRIGDLIYRRTGSDTKMVGQAKTNIPCYKLQVLQVREKQYEQWAISYEEVQIVPESYQIEKQKYQQEVYGEYFIIRTEVERREPESPDTYTAPLVSVDSGNDTAEVRVKEYKRSGRFLGKSLMRVSVMTKAKKS